MGCTAKGIAIDAFLGFWENPPPSNSEVAALGDVPIPLAFAAI
jgi:hypothetical protein